LFFIDLAVPRDVDPRVGELDSVFLYNVDDLSNVVADSMDLRRREADRAEAIVAEEAASYERWADAEQVTPTIVVLRERLRRILVAEVERSLSGKLRHLGEDERAALSVLVESALNKMLHPTTARLRRLAMDPASRADLDHSIAVLNELFELSPEAIDAALGAPVEPASSADDTDVGSDREAS
jgi:glutamyl-tRNA reductase